MQYSELPIPSEAEWSGHESDLDAQYAYDKLFGKSITEVQQMFGDTDVLARAEDLPFMPVRAFQYYIFGFTQFLQSESALRNSDAASCFLRLLLARESEEPGSVSDIYIELAPTVDFVASRQEYFDADIDIYGSFPELAQQLHSICNLQRGDG